MIWFFGKYVWFLIAKTTNTDLSSLLLRSVVVTAVISAVVCVLYLQELYSTDPHMTGCHYTHRSLNVFLFFYFMLKDLLDIYYIFFFSKGVL